MKRYLAILIAALLAMALLAACGEEKPEVEAAARETLVLAESSEWWGLDTTLLDGSSFTQGLVADPLVVLDENGNMEPCLASAVEVSEDGLTITLTIPKGMYYASRGCGRIAHALPGGKPVLHKFEAACLHGGGWR